MGVGLYLRGHSDTEGWIERLREHLAGVQHPSAEGIEVSDEGVVSASTTPVGPGYHLALCDALDEATGELGITWDPPDEDGGGDESGYFHERDPVAIERNMLQWLGTVSSWVLEQEDLSQIRIAMPLDHSYQAIGAHTPTGPRDAAWFRAVVDDPRHGIDFFPWWSPGDNAAALLGRARCLMWSDVRWREPSHDLEEDLHDEVVSLLERAWALDPSLDYPAREWCDLAPEVPDEITERARATIGPLIGYRRHPVRVTLADGWSVEIPGDFAEEWEDGTWSAWHDGRTVWFDAYRRDAPAPELTEAAPAAGDVLLRIDGAVHKKAYLAPSDDGFTLSTRNAVDGKLCVSTIVFPSDADHAWALHTWESFRCS